MISAGNLRAQLVKLQLPNGGWGSSVSSSQGSFESSALAYTALTSEFETARHRAREFLLKSQNPNGSWPAFVGDDKEGSWTTALVLIALTESASRQQLEGLDWLIRLAGEESDWLWKWKFLTTDRHVRFDPDKFGWPWIPHTNSWVVPTAFSIIALDSYGSGCAFKAGEHRVELGVQMLLDRACLGGGWNAGNSIVYGNPLAPHADDTAIALLALVRYGDLPIVRLSLDLLERLAPGLNAPWSLAWCTIALAVHGRPIGSLVERLSSWHQLEMVEDISTLAISSLALDSHYALARLRLLT